jgi:aminopeptidase-like protein
MDNQQIETNNIDLSMFLGLENNEETRKMIAKYVNLHFVNFSGKFKKKQFIEELQEFFPNVKLTNNNIVYHIWYFIQIYNNSKIEQTENSYLLADFCSAVLHDEVGQKHAKQYN